MNYKLYRQRIQTGPDGKIIYQGEDTHPYADGEVLIVADGLGGRGGFPHTKISKKIFDREGLYELMFEPIFPREVDDSFKEFVVNNFEEIFETSEYYFDADDFVRRSGYFASRIVTAITLYELKYNPAFKKETVFEHIKGMTDEQKDAYAMELGARLADSISEKLHIVADEIGFVMETRIGGAYLLPSTLTVALMNECEDEVEVLYLWAGDSRGYVWDEFDGMGQVTEDHERDETMTNLITLSKPFGIEGRFVSFKKPCVIFNATDGVYKPPAFANPIDQEYVMVYFLANCKTPEEAHKNLVATYNTASPDDSSTMALKAFGYDTYEELSAAMARRFERIKDKFLTRLPNLLERNYSEELERLDEKLIRNKPEVKTELIKVEAIKNVVRDDMLMRGYAPLSDAKRAIGDDALNLEGAVKEAEKAILDWIKHNWVRGFRLKKISSAARSFIGEESPYDKLAALSDRVVTLTKEHHSSVKAAGEKLCSAASAIGKVFGAVSRNAVHATDEDSYVGYDDAKADMLAVIEFIDSLRSGEAATVSEYNAARAEMTSVNDEYVEHDKDAVNELLAKILSTKEPEELSISAKCCEELRPLYDAYITASKNYEERAGEAIDLTERYVLQYWEEKSDRLVGLIWINFRSLIPESIYEALCEGDPELKAQREELVNGARVRDELYALYNETYFRNYRETRL